MAHGGVTLVNISDRGGLVFAKPGHIGKRLHQASARGFEVFTGGVNLCAVAGGKDQRLSKLLLQLEQEAGKSPVIDRDSLQELC